MQKNRANVSERSRSLNVLRCNRFLPEVARHHPLRKARLSVSIPVARYPILFGGLRPPNPLTRSLAGAPSPAPFAWAHSLRSFATPLQRECPTQSPCAVARGDPFDPRSVRVGSLAALVRYSPVNSVSNSDSLRRRSRPATVLRTPRALSMGGDPFDPRSAPVGGSRHPHIPYSRPRALRF